jgi:membrane-bound serine protease (ClpP class)
MDSSYATIAVITLALGLALLVAEVFIPSGGLIITAAVITFVVSIWAAWQAWFKTDQMTLFLSYVLALLVLFPSVLGGAFHMFPRTEYGKRLMGPPTAAELEPYVAETERLTRLIGKLGTSLTRLAPGGMVLIEGERLHAESEGMLIPSEASVKVLALKGNRLLVRQQRESRLAESVPLTSPVEHERTPLDDDLSQS